MQDELKPCPWCGVIPSIFKDGEWWMIDCGDQKGCHVRAQTLNKYKDKAIAQWNTRKEPA